MKIVRVVTWLLSTLLGIALLGVCGYVGYRVWPRPLGYDDAAKHSQVYFHDGQLALTWPARGSVVARLAAYDNPVDAYVYFDLLRSRKNVDGSRVMLCWQDDNAVRDYELYLSTGPDMLQELSRLYELEGDATIPAFSLQTWSREHLGACQDRTGQIAAFFDLPVPNRLQDLPAGRLVPFMAHFFIFKSLTDVRVRSGVNPDLPVLNLDQAEELASDMVAVARFYNLPLDYFLGIGAVENNYMNITGDLDHAVWKRRPAKGDVVLKRTRRRVLVRNYSRGVWQITRETLRYAQSLYRKDRDSRDYNQLPARLRPDADLDPDQVPPETLTTYAGLLFKELLDRFNGDVWQAIGAYNGGTRHPNPAYAAMVVTAAHYGRKVIEHAMALQPGPFDFPAGIPAPDGSPVSPPAVPSSTLDSPAPPGE